GVVVLGLGGGRTPGTALQAAQAIQAHQALNSLMVASHAPLTQRRIHPRATIGAPTVAVNSSDFLQQYGLGLSPPTGLEASPGIVTAWTHFQHAAHDLHLELPGMLCNESVFVQWPSRLNTTSAFFNTSLSWRSTSFSRLSRRTSSSNSVWWPLPTKAC